MQEDLLRKKMKNTCNKMNLKNIKYNKAYSINSLSFAIMLFIFSPVLSFQEVASPSFIYVSLVFLFAFIPVVLGIHKIKFKIYHSYAVLMLLFAALSTSLFEHVGSASLIELFKYFIFTLFYIFVTGSDSVIEESKFRLIFVSYILLSTILAGLVILSYLFGYAHVDSTYFLGRYSIGITGLYKNPNYIESFIAVGYFVLIYRLLIFKATKFQKIILIGLILLMFSSSFLSGTRAALLVFILIFLFTLINMILSHKNKLIIIIIIIIPLYVFLYKNIDQLQNLYNLFVGGRGLMSDGGRSETWLYILQIYLEKPILGHGLWSDNYFTQNTLYLEYIHNVFLELLSNQGLIGFSLFFLILFSGFKKTKKIDRVFILIFLFTTGFPMFFQNGFIAVNFWKFIIINRLIINYSIKNDEGITGFLKVIFRTRKECKSKRKIFSDKNRNLTTAQLVYGK